MQRSIALITLLIYIISAAAGPTCRKSFPTPAGTWYTKADKNGNYHFFNDAVSSGPVVMKGISMTGFETGTRLSGAGAGYWLFQAQSGSASDAQTLVENVMQTLVIDWSANIVRIPFCGSAWLQNYKLTGYGAFKNNPIYYRDWIDTAVCKAAELGATVILDNHLWAIGPQSSTTLNQGMEDGCTGINNIDGVTSCAPHDWFGQYTSTRTGKTYNQGDDSTVWQCPIANADGITLDNLLRGDSKEHFLNLWYELALRYKDASYVFFELFNEPYQRKSAAFGKTYGDNIPDASYNWADWAKINNEAINVIRGAGNNNVIIISGLDWNYDYLGDAKSTNTGPIGTPSGLLWKGVANIAYAFHPYQHGACCGSIGYGSDLSKIDPYQSAFCLFPPEDKVGHRLASFSQTPIFGTLCDSAGYDLTVDKKSPPCQWVAAAKKPGQLIPGLCAGDREHCDGLNFVECTTASLNWRDPNTGGWSKYVLPMNKYGPLVATEFGTFDCSSPFISSFLTWSAQFGVSYTAWALWPQNSGGPGQGACGYPSVMTPSSGSSDGFGKGSNNCQTLSGCSALIKPLAFAGPLIQADMKLGKSYTIPTYGGSPNIGATNAPAPATSSPTKAPSTPSPSTPSPATSAPATKAPTTPSPVTSAPVTPSPATSAPVAPSTPGSITVQLHSASSAYWFAVAVTSSGDTIAKVELQDSSSYQSIWGSFTSTSWGYWVINAAAAVQTPVSLRVTSSTGKTVVLSNVISSWSNFNPINTGVGFGGGSSTPSTPTPATPSPATNAPSTPAPVVTPPPTTPSPATKAPVTPSPSTPSPVPSSNPLKVQIHSGASAWWFAIALVNGDAASKIEMKDSGAITGYTAFTSTSWGYWLFPSAGSALQAPFFVKVTATSGKSVLITIPSLSPGSIVDSGVSLS